MQKQKLPATPQRQRRQQAGAPASQALGQEVYRVALTTAFLLQAVAAGFVPYIGAGLTRLTAASRWRTMPTLVHLKLVPKC